MLNRRAFLTAAATLTAGAATAAPVSGFETASMRGSIDSTEFGLLPGAYDDQSKVFNRMLARAAETDTPVFLPAGVYVVSNLKLPARVRLAGVPGATRIIYGGDGHLLFAEDAELIDLSGLVLDGANRWLGDHAQAVVDFRRVRELSIDRCTILGSGKNGIALERVSGRIERSTVSGAADYGIYSVEAGRMTIRDNTVADCGNGGILVHRWQKSEDGTIVSGNRVERILARNGGTGQFGNGINLFRADSVLVSDNSIADCAFSAIRANSASNARITSNTCLRSGETALYAEFAFEGTVVAANIVDGAANGISLVNFNEGGRLAVCSGNIVRNLRTTGPYEADSPGFGVGITAEAECTVTGNVVENAPRYGMHFGWGPYLRNVVASGNVIRDATVGIAVSVVDGVGAAVISDNVIDGAKNGAVVGYAWAKPVTGDLAREGAALYPRLTVDRNRVS